MFEVHFKTSEEAGALYGTEDLLKISLDSDDLKSFLRKMGECSDRNESCPRPRQLSRICFIERLGSPASSDLTLMFMNERRRGVTTEAMNFLSILFDVTLTGKGSGPIAKRYHNHTRQSSQTRHRTTSAREAQVMANEAQRVTEAINAMSMPKLVSVSTGANASTHTTLAPVPAPLVRESSRSRSASPSSRSSFRSSRSRSSSRHTSRSGSRNSSRSSSRGRKSDKPCRFFAKGNCKRGDKCPFKHGDTATPAPRRRSPSPAAKRSKDKKSKKDKKDKKSKREKKDKSPKASPCIQTGFAMSCLAATATRTQKSKDYWEFSKDGNELIRHHLKPRHRSFPPNA